MFLAIINDAYSEVKTELSVAPEELQMTGYIKSRLFSCLKCIGIKMKEAAPLSEFNVTIESLRSTLQRFGFSDVEIEMFLARFNIDPTAQVGKFDIDKLIKKLEKPVSPPDAMLNKEEGYVKLADFSLQQEKLKEIEKTIEELTRKLDNLLNKLNSNE